ncbi:methyltransferase domain-containing protein [uncultured Secundilactobacillus sp.]|uniref:methyltransferase domain-containing protein n=1 Tax=uncultured Secundilactobacillus sp. TaxID=2813935 RepID=UPI002588E0A2|nr:methyltransferase domain-containing protein [uncultured Secundilactobacillus sp.]
MTKRDVATQFLDSNLTHFRCPSCHAAFRQVADGTVTCEAGHAFDVSKKGTLFFLKAPVTTEYTTEMLTNRQKVLGAGFFDPMLKVVQRFLTPGLILDAGSGEGTTTKWLATHQPNSAFVGIDISKPAITLAGSGPASEHQPLFAVGDLARLPFADNGLAGLVNILSPANYQEFDRVLAPGGRLIKVIPNAHYLQELRALVYPEGNHATYDNGPVKRHFMAHYPNASVTPVSYDFDLTPDLFAALFAMTPLTWQAMDRKSTILQQGLTHVTADFEVAVVTVP